MVAIDFYSTKKNTVEVNGYHQHFEKYLLSCQTAEIHAGFEQFEAD